MAKKVVTKTNKKAAVVVEPKGRMLAYEVSLVVSPNADEETRGKLVEWLRKTVVAFGGQVDKTEEAGKKMLAYPIMKFNEAWYYFFDIHMPSDKAGDLNTKITFEDQVIRHLVVRAD